jgi:dipeptidase E
MIILTSNGLSSDSLIEKMQEYCKALSNAVIITTASVGYKEKDWHIPRLTNELKLLGLVVDYFDFDYQNPELLLSYDVIELNGGNPFYLLRSIKNSSCKSILKKLVNDKIVIGISAGSIVMQNSIELIARYSPEMNKEVNLLDLTGLGLSNIEVLPHYDRFINRFERFEQQTREYEIANKCEVIRINDGQGVIVGSNE